MTRAMSSALLIVGAGLIVVSAVFTLGHLSDRTVFVVLVPGFVVGLILVYWSRAAAEDRGDRLGKRGQQRRSRRS